MWTSLTSLLLFLAPFFWSLAPTSLLIDDGGNAAIAAARSSPQPQWKTLPIRDLRNGMRVVAQEPEGAGVLSALLEIDDPDEWRNFILLLPKPDGSQVEIELLNPADWLDDASDDGGKTVELDLYELGAVGTAEVVRIDPCPQIEPDDGLRTPDSLSGRPLVTGTFKHTSATVIDLKIAGESDAIGTTSNHPFWSEDRRDYIPAGELHIGERLRTAAGVITRLESAVTRPGLHTVYNLQIDGYHTYHVGQTGVLVHNSYLRLMPPLKLAGREGKLTQHAPDWGFGIPGRVPAGAADKVAKIARHIQQKATQARQGRWHEIEDAIFYFKNGHIVVTKPDGTLITILKNAPNNRWFNQARILW